MNLYRFMFSVTTLACAFFFTSANSAFPEDLNDVVFIEEPAVPGLTNYVRRMAVTGIHTVNVSGNLLLLTNSKTSSWPLFGLADINANAWVFVKVGETWYAGTWEFMRKGQQAKGIPALKGPGHLRFPPLSNFSPRAGEVYGFMLSGVVRNGIRPGKNNIQERTNVAFYKWGSGPISFEQAFPPPAPPPPPVVIAPIIELLQTTPDVM